MTGLGRQAKVLSEAQIRAMLAAVEGKPTTARDRTMILLSVRLGLRAKEIASTTWSMLTHAEGQLGDVLALPNSASKGKGGGRELPLPRDVRAALAALYAVGTPSDECVVRERCPSGDPTAPERPTLPVAAPDPLHPITRPPDAPLLGHSSIPEIPRPDFRN
jgi:integrase